MQEYTTETVQAKNGNVDQYTLIQQSQKCMLVNVRLCLLCVYCVCVCLCVLPQEHA